MTRLFPLLSFVLFACTSNTSTVTLTPERPGIFTELLPNPTPPNWANALGPFDYNFAWNADQEGVLLTDTYGLSDPGVPQGKITNVRVVMLVGNPLPGFSTNKVYATLIVDGTLFVGPENNDPPAARTKFYFDWPTNPCTEKPWKWNEIRPGGGHTIEAGGRLYAIGSPFTEGSDIRLVQSYVEVTFE